MDRLPRNAHEALRMSCPSGMHRSKGCACVIDQILDRCGNLVVALKEARKLLVIEGYYTDEDPQPAGVGRLIDNAIAAATGEEREG